MKIPSGFEVFDRYQKRGTATSEPWVKVTKYGALIISKEAMDLVGSPESVLLLFNPQKRQIGITAPGDDDEEQQKLAYVARPLGRNFTVSAKKFLTYHNVVPTSNTQYPVRLTSGVLVAAVEEPSPDASTADA